MSLFPKVLVLATSRRSHGGISSVVMAHENTEDWKKHHCRWIATHRSGSKAVKLWYFFTGMMQYICLLPGCRIVHMHIGEAPSAIRKTLFMKLAKLFGKRTIVHLHAFDTASTIEGEYKDVYRRLFVTADNVVVLSEIWKKAVKDILGLDESVKILYNPCPIADSVASDSVQKRKIIISAGVVSARKGYQDLLRAFAMISDRHPDWRLVFAGSGEIDRGKALAAELGISDRVDFPGWISGADKDRLFREASILCLPSYAEGFPMAVLDAWAYGLPVVATPVGSLPDIVSDGEDILLFEPGDCEALARQLDRMAGDSALRGKIADGSRHFADDILSQKTIGRQLGAIYDSLL